MKDQATSSDMTKCQNICPFCYKNYQWICFNCFYKDSLLHSVFNNTDNTNYNFNEYNFLLTVGKICFLKLCNYTLFDLNKLQKFRRMKYGKHTRARHKSKRKTFFWNTFHSQKLFYNLHFLENYTDGSDIFRLVRNCLLKKYFSGLPNEVPYFYKIFINNHEDKKLSSNDKNKLKRKIVNSFRKFSLKRTKSISNSSTISKSDSDVTINTERNIIGKWAPCTSTYGTQIADDTCLDFVTNVVPFCSEQNIPYSQASSSHPTPKSVIIANIPNKHTITIQDNAKDHSGIGRTIYLSEPNPASDKRSNMIMINPSEFSSLPSANTSQDNKTYSEKRDRPKKDSYVYNTEYKKPSIPNTPINSSFIPELNNVLNLPLSLALKEVLDIAADLQGSENNLKHLLSKYIQDESFEKDLLGAVSAHSKLQIDNERRSHKLASEMFAQQLDLDKEREATMQESLETLVQINRSLEQEIQTLREENEKIVINYESSALHSDYRKHYEQDILKNNDDLRVKLKQLLKDLNRIEYELSDMQTQKQSLINQLACSNRQIRSYKDLLRRSAADHELEHTSLSHQLTKIEQMHKDCVDAGDTLMEDLDSIKRQLKLIPLALNWTKFKCRGGTVPDLIHISRACINELSREIIKFATEVSTKNTENENQKREIIKLTEDIRNMKTYDKELLTDIENLTSQKYQLSAQIQKQNFLEQEIEKLRQENTIFFQQTNQDKNIVATLTNNIKELSSQLTDRDVNLSALKTKYHDCLVENTSLRNQLESMSKLLDDGKISTIVTELMETQNRCNFLQTQQYQWEVDKQNFIETMKRYDTERDNLVKYQNTYYEHLQIQQKDIDVLNQQNNDLKDELIQERKKCLEKDTELAKQIEESNMMKTMQSQLKSEFARNQALETNTMNVSFEANRFAVAAEYNNLISKQLKAAISEKDKTITNLKTNVEILKNAQLNTTEDKVALCREITEASYINKQLQEQLSIEIDTNKQLKYTKEQIESHANTKMQELHQMLLDERQALREIINDHKNLTTQRNNLLSSQNNYVNQIDGFKTNEKRLLTVNEEYQIKVGKLENQCCILTKELQEANKNCHSQDNKSKKNVEEYENKLSQRDELIENLKCDKEELGNSIKYLQCTSQKLYNDVTDLRNIEKEYKNKMASTANLIRNCQQTIEEQKLMIEQTHMENKDFEEKLNEALISYNSLLIENNNLLVSSQQKEKVLLNDLENCRRLNDNITKDMKQVLQESKAKTQLSEEQQAKYEHLKAQFSKYEHLQTEISEKSKLLETSTKRQHYLEEKIINLLKENAAAMNKIQKLSDTVDRLTSDLQFSKITRERDVNLCKSFMDDQNMENERNKTQILRDLNNVTSQTKDLKTKYAEKCLKYNKMKSDYTEIAEQMLRALNLLIQEKSLKESAEAEIQVMKTDIIDMTKRLESTNSSLEILTEEASHMKLKADIVSQNESLLHKELVKVRKLFDESLIKIHDLESNVLEKTEKLNKLENISFMEENFSAVELQNKTELLTQATTHVQTLEERIFKLKEQIRISNSLVMQQKAEVSHLYHKVQVLEFQKCELTLRYHELNGKLETQEKLNSSLKQSHQHLLGSVCESIDDSVAPASNIMMLFK